MQKTLRKLLNKLRFNKRKNKNIIISSNTNHEQQQNQDNNNNNNKKKSDKYITFFEGKTTVHPIQSRSKYLTSYPSIQKIQQHENLINDPNGIGYVKASLDLASEQMEAFKVTDSDILRQFDPAVIEQNGGLYVSENLYDEMDLWRFVDAKRLDGQIKNVISTKIQYALGASRPKPILDVNDDSDNDEDERQALQTITENQKYQSIKKAISKEIRRIGLHEYLIGALENNDIFGRAAIQKIYYDPNIETIPNNLLKRYNDVRNSEEDTNTDTQTDTAANTKITYKDDNDNEIKDLRSTGYSFDTTSLNNATTVFNVQGDELFTSRKIKIISDLVLLNPLRFGRTLYWGKNKNLAGIEYLDYKEGNNIVKAEDMIYFSGPNPKSTILPRCYHQGFSLIETLVDISETQILNNQVNFKEISKSLWAAFIILKFLTDEPSNIEEFLKNYEVGRPIATTADIEPVVTTVGHDLDKMLEQRDNSDMKVNRDSQIPGMLGGFSNVNNFATASVEFNAWVNSIIKAVRTMIRNVIEPQYIEPLIMDLMGLEDRTQVMDLEFKIKLEFENIAVIDPLSVNTQSIISLKNNGFINEEAGLELLGLKYLIPDLQAIREQKEQEQEELMKAFNNNPGPGFRPNPNNPNNPSKNKPGQKFPTGKKSSPLGRGDKSSDKPKDKGFKG